MKKIILKLMLLSVAFTASLAVSAASARAEIPQGFFKGEFRGEKHNRAARVFIKTVSESGVQSTYGVIFRPDEHQGSLFRIEELEDGSLSWVELTQNGKNLLGTQDTDQDATYAGQVFVSGSDVKLALTPTEFGRSLGCTGELELERSSGWNWVALPKSDFEVEGPEHAKVVVNAGKSFTGKFNIDGHAYSGTFRLNEIFPGIALLRGQTLSAESESGRAVQKEITAVVIVLQTHHWYGGRYYVLKMIRLAPGTAICLSRTEKLEE